MKIAIVGSRSIAWVDVGKYVTEEDEIVSGGAVGVDRCAADYARKNQIKLTELLPQYERYGQAAPIVRNKEIVRYADKVVVFWDGKSRGSLSVMKYAKQIGKPCVVVCRDTEAQT